MASALSTLYIDVAMSDVCIIGVGQTPVTRGQAQSAGELGNAAIAQAIENAGVEPRAISALYLGNMTAGLLEHQQQLASLCASACGLKGVEAFTLEASCASGAAALRTGYMAVAGGFHDLVAVCGVERLSHAPRGECTRALAVAADRDEKSRLGESFIGLNAALMRRYLLTHDLSPEDLAPFAITAHDNGAHNPRALLRKPLDMDGYRSSRMLVDPLRLMDAPPICDGAAAVILARDRLARALPARGRPRVWIRASAAASDTLTARNCIAELRLPAAERSSRRAYRQAGMDAGDIDLFEAHDAFTVITALSLESSGFAARGQAVRLGKEGALAHDGRLPISTMGGLKSRGHPVGATGLYQVVEAVQQLRGTAGKNQVEDARVAMTQNLGGMGATAITHLLEAA